MRTEDWNLEEMYSASPSRTIYKVLFLNRTKIIIHGTIMVFSYKTKVPMKKQ